MQRELLILFCFLWGVFSENPSSIVYQCLWRYQLTLGYWWGSDDRSSYRIQSLQTLDVISQQFPEALLLVWKSIVFSFRVTHICFAFAKNRIRLIWHTASSLEQTIIKYILPTKSANQSITSKAWKGCRVTYCKLWAGSIVCSCLCPET
jgi:hypothetical protein